MRNADAGPLLINLGFRMEAAEPPPHPPQAGWRQQSPPQAGALWSRWNQHVTGNSVTSWEEQVSEWRGKRPLWDWKAPGEARMASRDWAAGLTA